MTTRGAIGSALIVTLALVATAPRPTDARTGGGGAMMHAPGGMGGAPMYHGGPGGTMWHGGAPGGWHGGWGHGHGTSVFIGGGFFYDPFFYAYPFYGVPYPYYYPYGYGYGYAYPYYYPYPGADYGDATPPPYASSPEASAPPSGEAPPPGEALPPGEGPPSGEAPPPQAEAEGIPPVDLSTYGLIQIQGVPEGAKIDLDDRFWLEGSRELDHRWLALPSGTHTIDIRATGYESSERRVDITAGDRKVLKVRLSRAANG